MRPPDDTPTHEDLAELGALLAAARPQPSAAFAATLDARVATRFATPRSARSAAPAARRIPLLRWPRLPATAGALAVALVALVVALDVGGEGSAPSRKASPAVGAAAPATQGGRVIGGAGDAFREQGDSATAPAPEQRAAPLHAKLAAPSAALPQAGAFQLQSTRKVEQSSTLTLGAPADRIDDVAQGVLGVVAHVGGIVDASSIATSGAQDGTARFALRIPAGRLGDALAQLSQLPHAHVLSRSDDTLDVNRTYVSLRRRLENANAERAGLLRALRAATSEDETLRLQARLDAVERTIAATERAQRGLNRRIDYSRVELTVAADQSGAGGGAFTPRRALHDAGRLLAVAAGVVVIAAAALLPLALLAALAWPLARALRRRRRAQALDAV